MVEDAGSGHDLTVQATPYPSQRNHEPVRLKGQPKGGPSDPDNLCGKSPG